MDSVTHVSRPPPGRHVRSGPSGDPVTALVERHGLTPPGARPARFTVLVVIGNPFVRETIARSLRAMGAREVVEAGSLAEARVRARSDVPRDLCVVDGALPDGSGI